MNKTMQKRNISGQRIMEERQRQGLTRKALLAKLESYGIRMSLRTFSLLERQKRPAYDKEVYAISEALNVSMKWLLGKENVAGMQNGFKDKI